MFDLCSTQYLYLCQKNHPVMASVKVVLRSKKTKEGLHPLALQIIKNRRSSLIAVGHSVHKADWDPIKQRVKKAHPNSARLNNLIVSKIAEITNQLLDMEKNNSDVSSHAVKNAVVASKEGTFFKQADLYIKQLEKTGKFNRKSADLPRVNRFKEFLKTSDLHFSEITPLLLKQFQTWLRSKRKITERTIVNHLVVIRTIYNQAIAAGVADQKHYPFGKGKVSIKFPDSIKLGLTLEEVHLVEAADLSPEQDHARNLWLISFYFAGMRVSDVLRLKWSDLQNGRLYYTMGKNQKAGSLKVPDKAQRILDLYTRETPHDLVFPDLGKLDDLSDLFAVQRYIKTRTKSCNDYLKQVAEEIGLSKPLSMHIARHTFGNISGDKIPVQMLQKLYRHTSITTTIGYQANFINKTADDALDAVIGH